MADLYPLRFTPLYKHYLWGGRRFETLFGRDLDRDRIYAESWEVVDHDDDQSIVAAGPLAGASLHELVTGRREQLLGAAQPAADDLPVQRRFPLLMKLLDAAKNLSLQVHPDDVMAARLDPPDLGKTEAWYVLAAEPESRIYAGLRPGVDRDSLAHAIADGTCADCVHWFEPRPGDCLFIPAGTVHALGEGIVVAEIQQASDTTFRLFDWNRVGADGKPRPLHVDQGLEAIDFSAGPAEPIRLAESQPNQPAPIVECDYFSLARWRLTDQVTLAGDGHCHLLTVLDGTVRIDGDPSDSPLSSGQTVLLPASLPPTAIRPEPSATLLDVTAPH